MTVIQTSGPAPADVILFAGQSNMQGQSEALADDAPVPSAYEYKWLSDRLVPLRDPAGEDIAYDGRPGFPFENKRAAEWHRSTVLAGAAYGHSTLIPPFCRAYTGLTGRPVIAVPVAKGATQAADWLPGTPGYEFLVKKAAGACRRTAERFGVGRVCAVWLQGESDAIASVSEEVYRERLAALGAALRADVGLARFGIIRVGNFTNDARDGAIQRAQDAICEADPLFLMLTRRATDLNAAPECMNPHAAGHFSALGLSLLGEEAAVRLAADAGR